MLISWLARKGENARAVTATKDVKWRLEMTNGRDRAMTRIFASMWGQHFEALGLPVETIDEPMEFPRPVLIAFFTTLHGMHVQMRADLRHKAQYMRRMGMERPADQTDSMENMATGMEAVMATLTAGIVPDCRQLVFLMWGSLMDFSDDDLHGAVAELRRIDRLGSAVMGGERDWVSYVSDEELLRMGASVPQFVMRTARHVTTSARP